MSKITTYFVALRIDLDDEKCAHPKSWAWDVLLELPGSGGVEVLAAKEITLIGDQEDDEPQGCGHCSSAGGCACKGGVGSNVG